MSHARSLFIKSTILTMCVTLETLSCASVQEAQTTDPVLAKNETSTEKKSLAPTDSKTEPEKVQIAAQEEFARQLAKAGPKAEGWALFSDSPMTHNGQRWIIKSRSGKKDVYKYCFIAQGRSACAETNLSKERFQKIEPALKAAENLDHILPVVFDGLSYEYLHAFSGNPLTKRVVFITSMQPFPEAYQNLIKAFAVEAKKTK